MNEMNLELKLKLHHIQFSQDDDVLMMCMPSINLLSDSRGSLQRRASNWIPTEWLQRQKLCAEGAQSTALCWGQHQNGLVHTSLPLFATCDKMADYYYNTV